MSVILVTGTSKGLGYELAKQYLSSGNIVIGVSRSETDIQSGQFHHLPADVTSNNFAKNLEDFLASLNIDNIDVLINNAGTGSFGTNIYTVDPEEVLNQVNLHCVSALRVITGAKKYLLGAKIIKITSRLASVTQTVRGDFKDRSFSYSYRIAKAAQNMLSLCLANDPELASSVVLSINPGLLKTDSGSSDAEHSAEQGAAAVIATINQAAESGIYHAFGQEALY